MTHCAFTTDTGFCVCELWESQHSQQTFWDARLEQAIGGTAREMGVNPADIDIQMSESYMAYARELSPIHA